MTTATGGPYIAPPSVNRFGRLTLIVGVVATAIFAAGLLVNRDQFFHSYLMAFTFWSGIALGSLALLMLGHLTGGGWSLVIRRVLEASTRTLPLVLLLFVPIVFGAHSLYPWTHPEEMAKNAALTDKARYLNLPFFTVRALIYFAIWITLAFLLNRWSLLQDKTADRQLGKRMRVLAGPGMVLFVFTVTFASIDWFMSLDPEWSSTIFGFIFVAAWALSSLAFTVAMMASLAKHEPMHHVVGQFHFHDLGKLLLALVMLWSYFAFSQFLIIWSGNLPEEIRWYLPRTHGAWGVIAVTVVVLHFAFPFLFLLSRSFKRNSGKLVIVAVLILVMRLVDVFWTIAPNFPGARLTWMDLVAPVGIGGLWLSFFARELTRRPLIPINDPLYETVLEQVHEHAGH